MSAQPLQPHETDIVENLVEGPSHYRKILSDTIGHIQDAVKQDVLEAEPHVEHFQYDDTLAKTLSMTSVLGVGYGLMSPVLGLSTTMGIGLVEGGPFTILVGFCIVAFFSLLCALSVSEIVSKYPIELHGAVALMAGNNWRLISSWYTGFFLLIGNWTMSTSITFAGAQLILSTFGLVNDSYERNALLTVAVFYCVVTVCGFINLKLSHYLELFNKICVYWISFAILFIDIVLLVFSKNYNSLKFAFTEFQPRSGWPAALAFMVGFQQPNFTLQGFSMLPALAEEVKEGVLPKSITLSVLISAVSGVVFLLPIMIILPSLDDLFAANRDIMPIVHIFKMSTNSYIVSFFMVLFVLGNLLFSGVGSIATSSRSVYSMSRDKGLPKSSYWTQLDNGVPKNAIYLSMGVSYLLGLLSLISTSAFNAFVGAAVISLSSATIIPILAVLLSKRKAVHGAPFRMRYVGSIVNGVSILWLVFTALVLSMPVTVPVTLYSMNYAFFVWLLFVLVVTGMYLKWGRFNFQIPELVESFPMQTVGKAVDVGS